MANRLDRLVLGEIRPTDLRDCLPSPTWPPYPPRKTLWTRRPGGPDWMPITPKTGSLFHADSHYCLHVTLARRLHALAPGLTPRSVLEKSAAVQMIDVHLPTTDGRELVLTR